MCACYALGPHWHCQCFVPCALPVSPRRRVSVCPVRLCPCQCACQYSGKNLFDVLLQEEAVGTVIPIVQPKRFKLGRFASTVHAMVALGLCFCLGGVFGQNCVAGKYGYNGACTDCPAGRTALPICHATRRSTPLHGPMSTCAPGASRLLCFTAVGPCSVGQGRHPNVHAMRYSKVIVKTVTTPHHTQPLTQPPAGSRFHAPR